MATSSKPPEITSQKLALKTIDRKKNNYRKIMKTKGSRKTWTTFNRKQKLGKTQ